MSTLPKPLSEKNIARMLAGFKPETVDLLHDFFAACSNLYGVVLLDDAWRIFKLDHSGVLKRDFLAFSSIARREDLPYYILEVDELYPDNKRRIEDKFIVNKHLVTSGYYRFERVYELVERQGDKQFWIPDDVLRFKDMDGVEANESWKDFCSVIKFIKSSKGLPLCKYKHVSKMDKTREVLYTTEKQKAEYKADLARPVSERITERLKLWMQLGIPFYQYFASLMEEHNVVPSEKELRKMIDILTDANNTSNLWVNRGWAPTNMRETFYDPSATPVLTFGHGIKSMIAKGEMDKDEIISKLDELGIKYSWD